MKTVKQPTEIAFNALDFADKIVMLPIIDAVAQTTYEYIANSDTTVNKDNLIPILTRDNKQLQVPYLPHAGSYNKDKEDVQICLDLKSAKRIFKVLSDIGCRTSQGESYEDVIKFCNSQEEWHKIFLTHPGVNRLQIVKILKEELNLGLKEAKDLVDASPIEIDFTEYNVNKAKYLDILSLLQQSGATVQIFKETNN